MALHRIALAALGALLTLAAAAAALGAATAQDAILLKSKQGIQGVTILREGWDAIDIDENGDGTKDKEIPSASVQSVTYGDTPMAFRQAEVFWRQNRFDEAAENFEKALVEKDVRAWIKHHGNFGLGECRRRLGASDPAMYPKAREAYDAAIKAADKGRLVPDSMRGIGLCLIAENKAEQARVEFAKLAGGMCGPEWALRGKALVARALAAAGKAAEALALCDEVAKAPNDQRTPEVEDELARARAAALVAARKYAEARAIYLKMAEEADPKDAETRGWAYNEIGDSYMGEQKTKEALLSYLRVHILYFKAEDERARALYGAARCFTILKQSARAKELAAILEKDHPGSPWTAKAKKEAGG